MVRTMHANHGGHTAQFILERASLGLVEQLLHPHGPLLPRRVPAGVIQQRPFQAVDIRDSPALSPGRKDFDEPAQR